MGRLHWIIYKDAAITLILALLAFWFAGNAPEVEANGWHFLVTATGWLLLVIAMWLAISAWFTQWITEIAVTKRGFIQRRTAEMNMDKVESVIVTQSILGRILD